MRRKTIIVKHMIIAFLLLLIGSIDFLCRNLLASDYHPLISLLFVIVAIIPFIYVSHRWYHVPYEHVSSKIYEYYKDTIDDVAMTKDNSYLSNHTQVNDLEDLINHYKSAQKEQTELVCQLTNTNKVLDQNSKFANAIVQITSEILRSGDIQSILQLILNKAIEIIPNAQKGSILLCNNDFLEYKAMYGYDMEALKDFKFNFNEIFQHNAEDLYEPIIITNVEKFNMNLKKDKFNLLKETRSFELNSCISCAISIDNEFYGTINIDNIESNYAFVDEHKPIVKYFAEQIGVALKNAQLLEKILYMSQYDSLTSICNRAYFEEQLNALHEDCVQKKQSYVLIALDMNNLKLANDTFGHEIGDKIIVALIDYISSMEPKTSIMGRIGGDEFAIVYRDKSIKEVHQIMLSIRAHFMKFPFTFNNQELMNISFSYGASSFPDEGKDISTLFKNADYLMYIDKRSFKAANI
jgi:diguanylate cyclase (GGDEF)-like protein